jgi:hypothetical protein
VWFGHSPFFLFFLFSLLCHGALLTFDFNARTFKKLYIKKKSKKRKRSVALPAICPSYSERAGIASTSLTLNAFKKIKPNSLA